MATKDQAGTDHKDIYAAMNWVMTQVGYVQKTYSPELRYSFAGEQELIASIRPFLVEAKIVVYPAAVEQQEQIRYETKSGSMMNKANITAHFRFVHAPSGTDLNVVTKGEGADNGDKSFSKAMTAAYKYALRQALLIETGDDPDKTGSDHSEAGPSRQQPPKQQAPKPAAAPAQAKPAASQAKPAAAPAQAEAKKDLSPAEGEKVVTDEVILVWNELVKDAGSLGIKPLVVDFTKPVGVDKLRTEYKFLNSQVEQARKRQPKVNKEK